MIALDFGRKIHIMLKTDWMGARTEGPLLLCKWL